MSPQECVRVEYRHVSIINDIELNRLDIGVDMATRTYHECYRTLRIGSDCSWKELQLAYRRRVRICHPDVQSANNKAGRDDEFARVVRAYRLIARYHLRFGTLPAPSEPLDEKHAVFRAGGSESTAGATAQAGVEEYTSTRLRTPRLHVAVFAAFVTGVATAAIMETLVQARAESAATPGTASATRGRLAVDQLSVGMDPRSVIEIQGAPNHTSGSVWYYGDSGVIFDGGCVVGWENQSPYPLRTLTRMAYLPGSIVESKAATKKPEECVLPDS